MIDEYSSLLQTEVRRFPKVFIVIDALDECPESNGTRASFLAEIRKLQPNIHLLVTSRHILTMESRLARNVKQDPDLQEAIKDVITENTKGMQVFDNKPIADIVHFTNSSQGFC
jgi:hypothetical protein